MARIPSDEIERLKREIPVQRLAEARGIALARRGKDLVGLCPFHEDRTPSLVITPEKNLWHCMGACQTGGSVIDWVIKAEGISFRYAVEWLRADAPPVPAVAPAHRGRQQGLVAKHSTVTKLPVLAERSAEDEVLLNAVVDHYCATLKQSPEALAYLTRRGIGSAEMIERFRIGFANRTLGYRLPAKNRATGAELRGQLQRLGILRESGHEHFNGSIVIPIIDAQGCVTEIYGRKIRDDLREGTPVHMYLPGPHRGVWNLDALAARKEIILCEALIDAMTFWCAGFRNVTASYGVEGFSDDHLAAFREHETKRVLIAYDRDAAGDRAAEKLAERLMAEGIECLRVLFPKGMDANSFAATTTPASQSLRIALANAQWMGAGAKPEVVIASAESIAQAMERVIEHEHECEDVDAADVADDLEIPPLAAETAAPTMPEPVAPARAPVIAKDDLTFQFGDRTWRVRGLTKNAAPEAMRINVLCARASAGFHVDTMLQRSREWTRPCSRQMVQG